MARLEYIVTFQRHWKQIRVPWKEPNIPPFLFVAPPLVQLLLVFMSSGRDDVRSTRFGSTLRTSNVSIRRETRKI